MGTRLSGWLLAGLTILVASSAHAADVRRLVIVSAIGDTITIVTDHPETGTHVDRNGKQVVRLPGASFDKLAVATVAEAVQRVPSPAAPELVAFIAKASPEPTQWLRDGRMEPGGPLQSDLAASGASHLLLVTPLRAPAMLRARGSSLGSGLLEGIGFYIDRNSSMQDGGTGQQSQGFLAPFVYLRLSFIDLASGAVLREQAVKASQVVATGNNPAAVDPWAAIDARRKVEMLQRFIRDDLAQAVPAVLAAP